MKERTLSIIKPDAVKRNMIGKINFMFERDGFSIVAQKMIKMSKEQAGEFYAVHKDRPFYDGLVEQMSSYPVVVQVLERENAVEKNRELMGATDPAEAEEGTIRAEVGLNKGENSVHGSDSLENAKREISFFFDEGEIFNRD